jgi:multiple sugar transport system permease protein
MSMASRRRVTSWESVRSGVYRLFKSERWIDLVIGLILAVASVTMFFPFIWLIFSSFKSGSDIVRIPIRLLPEEWTLSGYRMVLDPNRANILQGYVNSLVVTGVTVVAVLFTSSLGGYVFARLEFPGKKALFYFILATTMVPFITLLIPLYIEMKYLGILDSFWALWLPSLFSSFGIFLCRQFIFGIPRDYYESAKIDGAGDLAIYWRIMLPLTRPVLSVLTIFTFLGSFNSFLWPLVVLNTESKLTLPLLLRRMADRFGGTDYQGVMAGSVLVCIPPLIVFFIFRRYIVRGIALTGVKG